MKQYFALLIISCLCLACQSSKEENNAQQDNITPKIEALGQRYLALGRFSGTILVHQNDSTRFEKSFGMANYEQQQSFTTNTAFKVGTLTQKVTTYIIEQMANDKRINLEAKASNYLPKLLGNFTVKDLLTSTSGLPTIAKIKEQYPSLPYDPIAFANKATLNRNNTNSDLAFNLLGKIIESQFDANLQKALDHYFASLSLSNTYFGKGNSNEAQGYSFRNYRGNGMELETIQGYDNQLAFTDHGLKSTVQDLLKLSELIHKGNINEHSYLNDDAFSYSLSKDDSSKLTIIVLSNRKQPITHEIVKSIKAILSETSYKLPLLREIVAIDPTLLQEYTGWYAINANMKVEIITENDSLFVMMGPNKVAILPQSDNQFYMKDNDAAMRFLRDASGKVNEIELLDGFINGEQRAKRVTE